MTDTSTEAVKALIALRVFDGDTHAADTLAALLDERDRTFTAIDEYLPTVIAGLNQIVDPHASKDELTEQEVSARAALSSAHWLVKSIANYQAGKAIYDLPSVVDLMRLRRRDQQRIRDLEAEVEDYSEQQNTLAALIPDEYDGDEYQGALIERFVRDASGRFAEMAERAERAEAEVERIKTEYDQNCPCDGGCNYNDGPDEMCSRHGRRVSEVWGKLAAAEAERDKLAAKLDAVKTYIEEREHPDDWGVPCVYTDGLRVLLAGTMTCPGCGHEVYLDPMDGWRNDSDGFTCEPPNTTHSQHILEPKGDEQ